MMNSASSVTFLPASPTPCHSSFIPSNLQRANSRKCRQLPAANFTISASIANETSSAARKTQRRSLDKATVPPFSDLIRQKAGVESLQRRSPTTLQINIGLTCNLACRHCHVESSPKRTETMLHTVAERLIELAKNADGLRTVDITGGAPEMHREFRYLVKSFSDMGFQVLDRCNLTVLEEPGQEDLVPFLAENRVKVVASLPCYTADNVEQQRGDGVFDASIRALQKLNAAGYGRPGTDLSLDLVYNPSGMNLPPAQEGLEAAYKRELKRAFDIDFSNLICITNMPIKRFADDLLVRKNLQDYMDLLVRSFNPATVESVMCLDMVHVAWDGRLYDCDFNYALEMSLGYDAAKRAQTSIGLPDGLTVFDIEGLGDMAGRSIRTGRHCYGCTAGNGSSCGGEIA